MPLYPSTRSVHIRRDSQGELHRIRFTWETLNQEAVSEPFNLSGTLHRWSARHVDDAYSGTYDISIYDNYESDVLNIPELTTTIGLTTGTAAAPSVLDGTFSVPLTGSQTRPVYVKGVHRFRAYDMLGNTSGIFEVWYWPSIRPEQVR